MKNIFLVLTLATCAFFARASDDTKKEVVIKTMIYCDHCLDCSDCGGKLVHDLSFVKGVRSSEVDPKAMTITVGYNAEKITPEKIREAISKMGYDADHVKADTDAYSKLDGCCKKAE
jgi:periplasmic mercuric ion binding protein